MGYFRDATLNERRDDGRSHSLAFHFFASVLEESLIRETDRRLQPICVEGKRFFNPVGPGDICVTRRQLDELVDGPYGDA